MSKLFISYRRKSWGFTHRLADELRERLDTEVFVDVDSIDQTDFEKAIVNHLRQSDVVLLVVSETTFIDHIHRDDDWVRREIREALTLNLPLVMVCVDGLLPPAGLPDDIKDIARKQGVNFYPEFFTPAVERLTDFVTRVSSVRRKGIAGTVSTTLQPVTAVATPTVDNPPERQIVGKASLDEALDLLDKGDFSKAIFLLEGLRERGFKSRFVNIDELLQEAQVQQKQAERRRTAQIDYEEIAGLVKWRITHDSGIAAFQLWQQEYPDLVTELDLENLGGQFVFRSVPESDETSKTEFPVAPLSADTIGFDEPDLAAAAIAPTPEFIETILQPRDEVPEGVFDRPKGMAEEPPNSHSGDNLGFAGNQDNILSTSVKSSEFTPFSKRAASIDVMPKPFDWVDIPAGYVILGGNLNAEGGYITKATNFDVSAFSIAKYPLTNAQFAAFKNADGYNQQKWWTTDGWQVREKEGWAEPRYWNDAQWNKPDYPVVGVSWFESLAFCKWLSEVSAENITLPTDQQWQRAAQGDTQWVYPYGNKFDKTRCNFNTQGITEVTRYEGKDKGESPLGVVDMSGNVWEWCLTKYDVGDNKTDGTDIRVMRGGSWGYNKAVYLRIDYRHWYFPFSREFYWGFRLARS